MSPLLFYGLDEGKKTGPGGRESFANIQRGEGKVLHFCTYTHVMVAVAVNGVPARISKGTSTVEENPFAGGGATGTFIVQGGDYDCIADCFKGCAKRRRRRDHVHTPTLAERES